MLLVLWSLGSPADSFSAPSLPFGKSEDWWMTPGFESTESLETLPTQSPAETDPPVLSTVTGVVVCIVVPAIAGLGIVSVVIAMIARKVGRFRLCELGAAEWADPARYIIKENLRDA